MSNKKFEDLCNDLIPLVRNIILRGYRELPSKKNWAIEIAVSEPFSVRQSFDNETFKMLSSVIKTLAAENESEFKIGDVETAERVMMKLCQSQQQNDRPAEE